MPTLSVQNCGQYGIVNDQAPVDLPVNAWSDGTNIRFTGGYAQRIGGYIPVFATPTVVPYALFSYSVGSVKYFVHAGISRVFADDGSTRTDITPASPYTGNVDDRWTGGSFNGLLILNNGVDQPQYWNGNVATKLATITGWNANWRAAAVRPYRNFLIALDITKSGVRNSSLVKWSDIADPGTLPSWDEADPTKLAGEQPLADTPDALVDAMPLGDQMILYKERSMYAMQPGGSQEVFRFTRLPHDYGMLARGCGAVTPLGHVVLTSGDLILHNGGAPQSLLTDRMRKWLFERIDQTNWRRCYLVSNNATNEVWVCVPEPGKTACSIALIWNWKTDAFGVSALPNTTCAAQGVTSGASQTWASDAMSWDSDATPWDQTSLGDTQTKVLMGGVAPTIIAWDTANDFGGTAFNTSLTRKHLCLDSDPFRYKLARSVRLRVDGPVGLVLNISVGASPNAETEPTYQPSVPFTVGSSGKVDVLASGKFHSLQIASTGSKPWRVHSYDIEYVEQGNY